MAETTEQKAPSGLAQRAVTGVILALIVLTIIWLPATVKLPAIDRIFPAVYTFESLHLTVHRHPKFFFGLLAVVFVMIGFREYAAMALNRKIILEKVGGTLAAGLVVLIATLGNFTWMNFAFFACVAVLAWVHILRGMEHHTVAGLAATVLGVVYLGWLPAHLVLLYMKPGIGPGLVTMAIATVAMSDSGAYFTGRAIGKHKLAPHTSPKKTWEGAAGGLVSAMLAGAAIYALRHNAHLDDLPEYSLAWYLITGAILSVVSQIGDLVESMLKRDADIKDSGNIFPGHGGILDRCDGILFACPALYYLVVMLEPMK